MATYNIDTAHSEIGFTARHMMFAKVRGQFKSWNAKLNYDAANPANSSVVVEIDTASIDTREEKRDAHLRSADFFDAEKFPRMVFKSKRVEAAGKGNYKLVGDLTIRDVSREVALAVEQTGAGKDPWGNDRLGFTASTAISRSEWGLKWNQALEAGGVLVSDKIEIGVEVQVVQAK
jgi:polyisoprenoid-binding protein YceI